MKKSQNINLRFKALDIDLEVGQFEGIANAFGVVDYANEQSHEGTFVKAIADWAERGRMPAFLWEHDQSQVIGKWIEWEIRPEGLWVKGEFSDGWLLNKAREGEIWGLSIGYVTTDFHVEGDVTVLDSVDVLEISLVSVPCNIESGITKVKSVQVEDETQVEEERKSDTEINQEQEQEEAKEVETEVGITSDDIQLASYLLKRRMKRR